MSTYKEEDTWIDKMLAGAVIVLTAGIALIPPAKVDLASVALAVVASIAAVGVLLVLRSGWLVNVLWTKCRLHWIVAASAVSAAVLGKPGGLTSAVEWAILSAGAWLALLLTLVVCRAVAYAALWPAIWLARHLSPAGALTPRGSYASPSPRRPTASAQRRYSAPAGPGAGYAAAAAASAATGYAGAQVWGDMHDPSDLLNPLNPLSAAAQMQAQMLEQMQAPQQQRMFPAVNTNGISMSSDSGVDDFGHAYGDPSPVFETPSYDYSNNFGGGCNTGGGFDF